MAFTHVIIVTGIYLPLTFLFKLLLFENLKSIYNDRRLPRLVFRTSEKQIFFL